MKILMLIDRYIPIWGGAENQLKQLAKHLENKGCTINILTRRWNKDMPKKDVLDDIPISRVGIPGQNLFSTIRYLFGLLIYVLKNRNSIDIIHSHGAALLGTVGKTLAYLIKKPNVAKITTAGKIPKLRNSFFGKIVLNIFKNSTAIICMSKQIEEELKSIHVSGHKIKSIKNAVDAVRFCPTSGNDKKSFRKKRGWKEYDPVVVFSGRFVFRKGLDILVNAWESISRVHQDARLILLGDAKNQPDSIEEEIKNMIFSKKLQNIFLDDPKENIEYYLSIADIFVMPSRKEGFPNALLEAMASGAVTVSSKIGGIEDLIIDGKTGILFPVEDSTALSTKIIELINNPQKREELGSNARKYVTENLNFDKISNEYCQTYKAIAQK